MLLILHFARCLADMGLSGTGTVIPGAGAPASVLRGAPVPVRPCLQGRHHARHPGTPKAARLYRVYEAIKFFLVNI